MANHDAAHPPEAPRTRDDGPCTLDLIEEQLVPRKERRKLGEIVIRTQVEGVPVRFEVDTEDDEVQVEHVARNQVVNERRSPWEQDGALIVPVYEEQLVAVKRLVLREELKIRQVRKTKRVPVEGTVRREKVVVDDPNHTACVHQVFPSAGDEA